VLLFFGYTHCVDVCPATLGTFAATRRQLGSAAEHERFIFITVDPELPAALRPLKRSRLMRELRATV
jgi:protein SCO1/2